MARPIAPSGSSTRPTRTPIGTRNILSVKGKDEAFEYRFVNDVGDRVAQFLEAGYELVDSATHRVGDNRIHAPSPEGSKAQISVGKGDKAFLMRIPKEYYMEDQLAKQQEVNRLEQSIKQSSGGDYGQVSVTVGKPTS